MNLKNPALRFDAFRDINGNFPYRMALRVTLADLNRIATDLGLSIDWNSMRMIGVTTAEINLDRATA